MGAKKRGQDQIIFEILKVCNGRGVIITKIAGLSNLNFRSLPKYINLLVENDLIAVVSEGAILYKTLTRITWGIDLIQAVSLSHELF
jgi:predicted transcriptional regulator